MLPVIFLTNFVCKICETLRLEIVLIPFYNKSNILDGGFAMRRFMRTLGRVSFLSRIFSFFLEIGHVVCIFAPLTMLGLSPLLSFLIAAVVFFLDKPAPVIAWLAHLAIWIASIFSAVHCQEPKLLTLYLICAVAYFIVEILCTGFIVIAGSKQDRR